MEGRTFSELVEDITRELADYDSKSLASLAEDILNKRVRYNYESEIFEVS